MKKLIKRSIALILSLVMIVMPYQMGSAQLFDSNPIITILLSLAVLLIATIRSVFVTGL